MRQSRMLVWAALLCALPLTACAPRKAAVPASLLQCRPQPALELTMDDQGLATWLLDTVEAGEDCRSKLGLVRGLVVP